MTVGIGFTSKLMFPIWICFLLRGFLGVLGQGTGLGCNMDGEVSRQGSNPGCFLIGQQFCPKQGGCYTAYHQRRLQFAKLIAGSPRFSRHLLHGLHIPVHALRPRLHARLPQTRTLLRVPHALRTLHTLHAVIFFAVAGLRLTALKLLDGLVGGFNPGLILPFARLHHLQGFLKLLILGLQRIYNYRRRHSSRAFEPQWLLGPDCHSALR